MIPIVALGCYRDVALKTNAFFAKTPYQVVAVADLSNPEERYQYTAHNLGVILHALDPPPQVIIIGAGISSNMADEAKEVFEKYVQARKIDDTTVIDGVSRSQSAPQMR